MKKLKGKASAPVYVCQSREQAQQAITELGEEQRKLSRLEADINDQIGRINNAHKETINAHKARIDELTHAVQAWADANRIVLCPTGKTANLMTGEIGWRQRPPSVSIRGAEKVLELLRARGLMRFIRVKEEPNKEAMLAEPAAVAGIPGLSFTTGVEDFVVTPFEIKVN